MAIQEVYIQCSGTGATATTITATEGDYIDFNGVGTSVNVWDLPSIFTDRSTFVVPLGGSVRRQLKTPILSVGTYEYSFSGNQCSSNNERGKVIIDRLS